MKCGNFLKIFRINKGCRPVAKLSHTDSLTHIIVPDEVSIEELNVMATSTMH